MNLAKLTATCADILPGKWERTDSRPRHFGLFLLGASWRAGPVPYCFAVTNGPILVCVATLPDNSILRVFAETSERQVSDRDVAGALAQLRHHAHRGRNGGVMTFDEIPQMPRGSYMVHCEWRDIEHTLARWGERKAGMAHLDLDPDFQRGHVWTEDQQRAYVEFKLQGGRAGSLILFNCVGWTSDYRGPFVLVDGKQRIEAVRRFMRSELPIFGGHRFCDIKGHMRSFNARFEFEVNNLETRADVLNWYLGLNSGGVVHTADELNRVRALLQEETP